jgi:hypothetical protein
VGTLLVVVGLALAGAGVLLWLGIPLGRLPGDLVVRRGGFTLYLPITTCLLASALLSLVAWLLRR